MAQDYSQVNFRIPTKLKEDIEKAAQANNRSITSELVSRLEESFTVHEKTIVSQEQLMESQRLLGESIMRMQESLEQSHHLQARLIEKNESLYRELKELKSKKPPSN
jgi:phosphoenolpyruvate carboxylase